MIKLADSTDAPAGTPEPFHLDGSTLDHWGRLPRVYSPGYLPSLFERSLVIDEMDLKGGAFEWLFTGDLGGVTVRVTADSVSLSQRYYDSYALNEIKDGTVDAQRHPEKKWLSTDVQYEGPLKSLTVTLDHRLDVALSLNGSEVLKQHCFMDLNQQQLSLVDSEGFIKGSFVTPPAREASVRIDADKTHQKMLGFGGIATPTAYRELSSEGKQRWWEIIAEYNLLIQREYPIGARLNEQLNNWDRLDDATAHYYSDNFPNGEISDFQYLKGIRKLGGRVLFEFWDLPIWMSQQRTNEKGELRHVADPEKYAKAMVQYCRLSKQKVGVPPEVVGIQNETLQPTDIFHQMTLALRRELDAAGFQDVSIHLSDASGMGGDNLDWSGTLRALEFKKSPEVWAAIDYSATHVYDYQGFFHDPDAWDETAHQWNQAVEGKTFISTELCLNSSEYQIPSYRVALTMGQLYHKNLVLLDAIALCYCWILLNVAQPSFGWTRTLVVPDKRSGFIPRASSNQLRVFGAFSRRIKENMLRVDASSEDSDLLASAYVSPDGAKTVVLLNRGTLPVKTAVGGISGSFRWMEVTDPYNENAVQPAPKAKQGQTAIEIPPGAIVTLTDVPLGSLPTGFEIP